MPNLSASRVTRRSSLSCDVAAGAGSWNIVESHVVNYSHFFVFSRVVFLVIANYQPSHRSRIDQKHVFTTLILKMAALSDGSTFKRPSKHIAQTSDQDDSAAHQGGAAFAKQSLIPPDSKPSAVVDIALERRSVVLGGEAGTSSWVTGESSAQLPMRERTSGAPIFASDFTPYMYFVHFCTQF